MCPSRGYVGVSAALELGADVIWTKDSDLAEFDVGFDCDNKVTDVRLSGATVALCG